MKKYNRPEIETLALETIDVIATSGTEAASAALQIMMVGNTNFDSSKPVEQYGEQINELGQKYSW